jgi:hypothetical protein
MMEGADLIAIAHNHRLFHAIESKITPDGFRKLHMVRTGGYLKYPQYMHKRFAPIPQLGSPIITFHDKVHSIQVDVSDTVGKL